MIEKLRARIPAPDNFFIYLLLTKTPKTSKKLAVHGPMV